ncbi:hypothetical protein QFC19_000118 [Naganishia cerealis]|uniref:Uncharacterized protein n=1 Tax=Naganishia cerealis TaxID=610337 RepID=A0ACC2WR26_9TREE|nr:hypothetical protein QFC19_000118 [Naganishia cerealis]
MAPVRALPWKDTRELAQLYAWIWDDPEDAAGTARAVARDLPTYDALRGGAGLAVEWIRTHVMAPLVFPSSAAAMDDDLASTADKRKQQEEAWLALVKRYKSLLRAYFRERTTTSITASWSGARDLRTTLRGFEERLEALLDPSTPAPAAAAAAAAGGSGKREDKARWLARRVIFATRGGLVPNPRKRPTIRPSSRAFPRPGEAEVRVWTPLMALIGDKFAASARQANEDGDDDDDEDDEEEQEQVDENEEDGRAEWPTWCLSEGTNIVLAYITTRDAHRPTTSIQKSRGTTTADATAFAHDADYLHLPRDEDEDEEPSTILAVGKDGAEEREEQEQFMLCLLGWLAFFLSPASHTFTAGGGARTNAATTGKRRRIGLPPAAGGETVSLDIITAGGGASVGWRVNARGRRRVFRRIVKHVGRPGNQVGLFSRRIDKVKLGAQQADGFIPLCEALVRRLAAAAHEEEVSDEEDVPSQERLHSQQQGEPSLEGMEHRLALFRKLVMVHEGYISQQKEDPSDGATTVGDPETDADGNDARRKRMRGWVRLDGWKECPIGYWRGT